MKIIKLKIEECRLCPYHDVYGDCMITGSRVRDKRGIPDGCPLEDA